MKRDHPDHGTETRYRKHNCRCDKCRAVHNAYVRDYRARSRQRGRKVMEGKVAIGTDSLGRQIWRAVDNPMDKLMARVVAGRNSCLIWTGGKTDRGYGHIDVNGARVYTHRLSYELYVGPIPDGLVIDHLCRNRACCNPHHLEPVTPAENTRRGEPAQRTHCPQGHPYDKANTLLKPSGARECRECGRQRERRKRATRTHCARGHEMTEENTVIRAGGTRCCRTCRTAMAARKTGELNPGAKLTSAQVGEIRARLKAGEPRRVLAAEFGVSCSTVSRIASGTGWGR